MMKNFKQLLSVVLALTIVILNVLPANATEVSTEEATGDAVALIDVQDVQISSGSVYDLSTNANASDVYALSEGTLFVEFETSSTQQYQSLFSVSNPTADEGNMYRHFHVYITPSGTLGMELRNTDDEFKYTMSVANVISSGSNRIAFKADSTGKTYKLFANGAMVGELAKDDFKFFADITGLTTISLGGTIRNQTVGYPFGGTISRATVYNTVLSDNDLINMTRADDAAWIDKSNITITSGEVYDLSSEAAASEIYGMNEGTIFVEYESTSTEEYQSLFSVSNPTTDTDNMYRHFHVYITPTGTLGMELRNTDSVFKYSNRLFC